MNEDQLKALEERFESIREAERLVEWYLDEVGSRQTFNLNLTTQRFGQAFFNALPKSDQNRLQFELGGNLDPFYSDDPRLCAKGIEDLLTKDN